MKHCLPAIIDYDRVVLIVGTMPGEKSIALQQYYGNRGNHFWKILFTIFDEPFRKEYNDRLQLLETHKIALWNVLASCERNGSQDNAITNEEPNDFEGLHDQYPNISHVFFESKAAEKFFLKYCRHHEGIAYTTLPSTSGLNAGMKYEDKVAAWMQVARVISLSE
jgi:hypoxanthine-DNA glycosylase